MKFKRIVSFLLALVLLVGMLPPVSVRAEETEPVTEETVETTEAFTESFPEETTGETQEASIPEETFPEETPAETEQEETAPEETVPEETQPQLRPEGYTAPRIPRHWYITEEEYTWTEDVTVVEPNEDGTYSAYETTQTFRETYYEMHQVGEEADDSDFASMTQEDNTYRFTEFSDLEQLAQGTYEYRTVALYTGSYPFTIERSITLPKNLQLQFSGSESTMVIPAGVTFANTNGAGSGSIRVDNLTVAGTFRVNDTLYIYKSLKVTGNVSLEGEIMLLMGGVTVSGCENITCYNYTPRWAYSYISTESELKAAVKAANSDTTGWEYLVEVSTNSGDVTLSSSLTIPENVQLNIYGDGGSFFIESGATLTLNAFYCYIGAPIQVKGNLVNNCAKVYVWSPVTVTGSYTGTGNLYVNRDVFSSWDAGVVGLDPDRTVVSEVSWGSWWQIRDINDLTRLAQPDNVTWHKRVVRNKNGTQIMDGKGHIYWKSVQPNDDRILIRFYNADTQELVWTWNCSFGGQPTDDRSVDAFLDLDPPSGRYYFTITSTPRSDSSFFESHPVTSGVWNYTQTGVPMGVCRDLQLNFPVCSWQDPAAADDTSTHEIEIFYSSTENGTPRSQSRIFGFTGTTYQINQNIYQNCGAGWYSFRVRTKPNDITQYRLGDWSEVSEAFYYDPATFSFDENWILDHIGPGPNGTEHFVATNGNPIKLKNDFTIPAGVVMDINGGSLTVPAGKTLTVNADQVSIYAGGRLVVEEGGTLIVNRDICMFFQNGSVESEGTIICNNAAIVTFWNMGTYGGVVTGIPMENQILVVRANGNAAYWDEAFDIFEQSGYGWTVLEVWGDVLLNRDLTTPKNSGIQPQQGSTLSILPGNTLTISKYSNIYMVPGSTIHNSGTINICCEMNIHGDVVNDGTVTLMEGEMNRWKSFLNVFEGASFQNNGTVTVNPWTDLMAEGTWTGNAPENRGGDVYGDALSMTQAEFTAAVAAAKKAGENYVLDQTVVLTKSMALDHSVEVTSNAMVMVQKGATLTVNKPLYLSSGADLQIFEGAKLVNNTTIYCSTTSEGYGSLSVSGTYVQGEDASLKVTMTEGTPVVSGIDKSLQTAYYRPADTEDVLEAMALEGYGAIEAWTDNLYLTEDLVIPANAKLIINPSWSDLQNGTRNDWVYLNSNVTVYGELHANAYYNGTPCNLEINGNVKIMPGGLLYVVGHVRNNGNIHVAVDGRYERYENFGGTWEGKFPSIDQSEKDIRDMIKAGQQNISLNNAIVLTDDLTIPESVYLRIYGNGSLTVPAGVTLTMNGNGVIYGGSLKVNTGGRLMLNGYIDLHEAATVDVQGTVQYGSEWAFFRHNYITGMDGSSLSGISPEHLSLSVHFMPSNKNHWKTCADLVENNDYPIFFMIVTNGQVTLPRSMTIPENTLLHVDGYDTTLVIPEGMTLTNYGDVYVWYNSCLKNYGTIENRRGFHVMGRLYNDGDIQLNESIQTIESFFEVQKEGYVKNNGLVSVNEGGYLWMMGTWEGEDPVENGGHMTMGRYQGNSDGAYLSAGQSLTLKVWDCMEGKALPDKQVTWSLPEEYAAYATINAKGKLTARAVTEQVTIKAVAVVKATGEEVITTVHLYPSVTYLEVLDGEEIINGKTVPVDVSEKERSFALNLYPLDLNTQLLKDNWCSWTITDKSGAIKKYDGKYNIKNGVLTIEPTGKTGTVTVKVSYNVGTKKTVTFKLSFNNYADEVQILNTETQLAGGGKLTLQARVLPLYAAKTNVTWSLKDPADKAYVTLSKNVLKAKTVYGSHEVILMATSADGQASAEYPITIVPKNSGILTVEYEGRNVTKSTVYVDLNKVSEIDLAARIFGAEETASDVVWTSSATKVAVVSGGRVTFLKPGTATITAKVGSNKATVTVKAARLASRVTVTGASEVASGKSIQLKAAVENAASSKVTWKILSGGEFGKISSAGKFTAAKNLTVAKDVIIVATAADGSKVESAGFTVTVRPLAQGIRVYTRLETAAFSLRSDAGWRDRSNTTLRWDMNTQGARVDLGADVFPYYGEGSRLNAIQNVKWKSSSAKVAAIRTDENGTYVECLKPGTVTITATAADNSGKKITFKLTVVKTASQLILANQTVKGGKSLNLAKLVKFDPEGVSEKGLVYSITEGSAYASVSASGVLKTKKVSSSVTVLVTVAPKEGNAPPVICRVTILP